MSDLGISTGEYRMPAIGHDDAIRRCAAIIGVITVVAFVIRIAVAFLLPTIHHSDEIFQILEPAHRWAFGTGTLTWEWRTGIRSWLLPGAFALIMRATAGLAAGPYGYLSSIAVIMTLLSLGVVIVGGALGARLYGAIGALITGGLCAIWYEFIYYAPSTLADAMAAHILVVAAYVGWIAHEQPSRSRFGLLGLLLGSVFCIRFQMAPALGFAAIYLCRLEVRQRWLPMIAGACIPLAVLALVDTLTLGLPLQSLWMNLWVNLVEGRSGFYGVAPRHWYLFKFIVISRVAAAAIGCLVILYARRFRLFAGMIVVQLLAISLVPHKEMRFLYPVMPLVMILAGLGTTDLVLRFVPSHWMRRGSTAVAVAALAAWGSLSFFSAAGDGFRAHWGRGAEALRTMAELGTTPDFCGLAVMDGWWNWTGGYTYLHSSAPISLIVRLSDVPAAAAGFNYAIVPKSVVSKFPSFNPLRCWPSGPGDYDYPGREDQCLLRRPGVCTAETADEISAVLARWGF